MATNYVYMLYSGNKSYTGFTNNPARRLRQHNGIIRGGAKSTRGIHDWRFLTLTSSDWTKQEAMKAEYKFKHPDGKRKVPAFFRGIPGRLNALEEIWKRVPDTMCVRVCPDHLITVQALQVPTHVQIKELDMNEIYLKN